MRLIDSASLASDPLERCRALEAGNIIYFAQIPFVISSQDREALLGSAQSGGSLHKNISYRPKEDRLSGLSDAGETSTTAVLASLRTFSQSAIRFAGEFLPQYQHHWRIDYASFRGIEEEGRDLPWKKRNDLLHTDAFPTRPTNGDLILRFFANINPSKERVWITSDPFEKLAAEYARDAGLPAIAAQAGSPLNHLRRAANAIGLPVPARSPYDRFMLGLHDYLKKNENYQRTCAKYQFSFPPNSAWMVFTDVVPHSVLSGQHALEQTFIISRHSLARPDLAPIAILENIAGRRLSS